MTTTTPAYPLSAADRLVMQEALRDAVQLAAGGSITAQREAEDYRRILEQDAAAIRALATATAECRACGRSFASDGPEECPDCKELVDPDCPRCGAGGLSEPCKACQQERARELAADGDGFGLGVSPATDARRERLSDRELVDLLTEFYTQSDWSDPAHDVVEVLGDLLRAAHRIDEQGQALPDPQGDPRTYVVSLPVVVSVYPDGRVAADVDLSEVAQAPFEDPTTEHGYQPECWSADPEQQRIDDRELISTALEAQQIQVS